MDFVRGLLAEQRKRAVGSILSHCEQSPWWHRLSVEEQRALREKVLSSLGQYHDVVLDSLKASIGTGTIVNDEAIRLIVDTHDKVARLSRG